MNAPHIHAPGPIPPALATYAAQKWAIAEGYEPTVAAALARAETLSRDGAKAGIVWIDEAEPSNLYARHGAVALIPVRGVLLNRFPVIGWDWATGYDGIRAAVAAGYADESIRAVALVIDSGGGMVAGCFELCDWLRSTADASEKPLVAIVENWAASAAYAIASSTQSISAPITGGVGSIGVLRMHLDMSAMLEAWGLSVSLIQAGAHKTDGNPFKPLPDPVREEWQAGVEALRAMFAERVAAGRPIDVDAVLATEARFYNDPLQMKEAERLGLLDAIVSPDDALTALADHAATLQ